MRVVKKDNEAAVLKNQLARCLADYDNLRKRTEAEKALWGQFSTERVLIKLIPILDSLESAQKHLKDSGLAIASGEFRKVFKEEGIVEIRPQKNEVFNPELHEAIELVQGGNKGKISELVLVGWKFEDGNIIRPAKVKVFSDASN
ncbi:nucleotide exchange factor GrpE [Candidatus Woesebacteria bacterium RBG_19FT_COMBO_42_9]|uniref:Protein GrpE n=1 Tax=Candidatus Woesebacteria bacterium RBG_16_42_24 TaxID=1802485 RepID=A0A1F7XNM7_9BACT|nr:MAG: nucleotide exchange factor GrpE [Candidatus Woesebacteria bacterium RBG_16_42_24]OGM17293.1 MAG: nucleotide exchange factor GrpE [Candidatus Woesebacteria bacterium RBG_19FT_COMBO_42_9]OGM68017.1 MAG: nucleotide exchange factor GrpE [Candidatus Woesebacteria bacterium RIFCSPLOWO2_01_FULL_43_11]